MSTAIIAAVASVLIALFATFVPLMSAKQQREVAIMEADLLQKLRTDHPAVSDTGCSSEVRDLEEVLRARLHRWALWQSRPRRWLVLAWQCLALTCVLLLATMAVRSSLDPTYLAPRVRTIATASGNVFFIAATCVGLLGVISTIAGAVTEVAEGRSRTGAKAKDRPLPGPPDEPKNVIDT